MFADNIILFAEVYLEQMQVIKQCLDAFCFWYGQKVIFEKYRIYFSMNVSEDLATHISTEGNIPVTNDMGIYLGVSTLHANVRVLKDTYQHFLDRVKAKLAGWKANSLSLAGLITLAKHVLNAVLFFYTIRLVKSQFLFLMKLTELFAAFI